MWLPFAAIKVHVEKYFKWYFNEARQKNSIVYHTVAYPENFY